jgi:hypothetical protein
MGVDPYRHLAPRDHHRFTALPGDPRLGQDGVKGQSAEFGQFLRVVRARMGAEAAGLLSTSTACRSPRALSEKKVRLAGVSTDEGNNWTPWSARTSWICCTTAHHRPGRRLWYNGSALVCGSCTAPSTNQPIY